MVLCVGKLTGTGKANGPGYPERPKRLKLSGAEGRYRSSDVYLRKTIQGILTSLIVIVENQSRKARCRKQYLHMNPIHS